jgi:hypothetical protein
MAFVKKKGRFLAMIDDSSNYIGRKQGLDVPHTLAQFHRASLGQVNVCHVAVESQEQPVVRCGNVNIILSLKPLPCRST